MGYYFEPKPGYRYELKEGFTGPDVAAVQLNVGVEVDGFYGKVTRSAVEAIQQQEGLVVDGKCGPRTQKAIVRIKSGPFGKQFSLPKGILVSIANAESNFILGAYSPHPSDSGFDLGAYQRSLLSPSQQDIKSAYDVAEQALATARKLRQLHDKFSSPWPVDSWYVDNIAEGKQGHMSWQLAILDHNWPEAAEQIWKYGHIHPTDEGYEDSTVPWIVQASGGILHTPREWVTAYIRHSTVYTVWP